MIYGTASLYNLLNIQKGSLGKYASLIHFTRLRDDCCVSLHGKRTRQNIENPLIGRLRHIETHKIAGTQRLTENITRR